LFFLKTIYTCIVFLLGVALFISGCGAKPSTSSEGSKVSTAPAVVQASSEPKKTNAGLKEATDAYRSFVIQQSDLFVKGTSEFTAAVKAGDISKAKELYAPTRMFYERIEPIAEALGDLDPNIDAREGDVEEKNWRGFHRLEKALWADTTTKEQGNYADQLLNDSKLLRAKVETVEIETNTLVTGAVELLNEVSSSKVTGEEERYSHTDLYDFAANVEGANQIFALLQPELQKKDAELAKKIEQKFTDLFKELAPFKKGSGYVDYTELTKDQVKKLSQTIDALAEPLSHMGKVLEG
jgi:iron uptake system component EfeO